MNVFLLKDKVYTEYKEKVMRYMLKRCKTRTTPKTLQVRFF